MLKSKTDRVLTGSFGFIIFLCILFIIKDLNGYRSAKEEYGELNKIYPVLGDVSCLSVSNSDLPCDIRSVTEKSYFDKLYDINPDLVCILSVPSLNLMYPVVQGIDNEKYLTYTFEGNRNPSGCLFMDYENDSSSEDENICIYGHNMKDGSMFGCLKRMLKEDFDKTGAKAFIITGDGARSYIFEKAEVVNIDEYKAPQKRSGKLTLYTCWGNDKTRRLLVTFSKEETAA